MLNTRLGLIYQVPYYLGRMATIATRYSFLRRQFEGKDGKTEALIIQYQMQQMKIIPSISNAWATMFATNYLYGLNKLYKDQLALTKG